MTYYGKIFECKVDLLKHFSSTSLPKFCMRLLLQVVQNFAVHYQMLNEDLNS